MVVSELIRVECQECGKKYGIDSVHVKGERAKIRCSGCNNDIIVSATKAAPPKAAATLPGWVEEVDDISMPTQHDPHADLIAELSETDEAAEALFPDFDIREKGAPSQDDAISEALSLLEGDDDADLEFPDWDIADGTEKSASDTLTGFPEELALQAELDLKKKNAPELSAELVLGKKSDLELEAELDLSGAGEDEADLDIPEWSLDESASETASVIPDMEPAGIEEDIEITLPAWALRDPDASEPLDDDEKTDIELTLPRGALRSKTAAAATPADIEAADWDETDTLAGLLADDDESDADALEWPETADEEAAPAEDFSSLLAEDMAAPATMEPADLDVAIDDVPLASEPAAPAAAAALQVPPKAGGLGLTSKFLLSTLIPLFIVSAVSILLVSRETVSFQRQTMAQSMEAIQDVSEGLINQVSASVARQVRAFIALQPEITKEDFNRELSFKRVALQSIGRTGFTGVYEIGTSDEGWRFWASFDAGIVGKDLKEMRGVLKGGFDDFWGILTGVESGKRSSGYTMWPDKNGKLREVYMVCHPVQGTPYAISAIMFADEITRPIMRMEESGEETMKNIWIFNGLIIGGGVLLIALFLFIYSQNITGKIKQLRRLSERISLGDMDASEEIIFTNDELGDLSRTIIEMQENIRNSVERMRRRLR